MPPGFWIIMIIRAIREIPSSEPVAESHTCFVSMASDADGGYHAAYREFSPDKSGVFRSDIYNASVRYQHYSDDLQPDGPSRLLRERLEDPRVFTWRGVPYCVALDETTFGFGIYKNVVINLITCECNFIHSDLDYDGKNWMPLPDGEDLYFIRSVDPWRLMKVHPNWHCTTVGLPNIDQMHIGSYRGGAAAAYDAEGTIHGIGHKTIALEHHLPYLFSMGEGGGDLKFTDLDPVGFGNNTIIDPTTILPDGKILCACSNTTWDQPHLKISMNLCELV
jgi:hypothetical protein